MILPPLNNQAVIANISKQYDLQWDEQTTADILAWIVDSEIDPKTFEAHCLAWAANDLKNALDNYELQTKNP